MHQGLRYASPQPRWAALCAFLGCLPAPVPSPPLDESGLVIAAVFDPISEQIVAVHARRALAIAASEDLRVFAWSIPDEALGGEYPGDPDPVFEGKSPPIESCGRCLAPSPFPPAVLHPGDLCPIPEYSKWFDGTAWSDGEQEDPVALRIRNAISLAWPGSCAFPKEEIAPATPRALRTIPEERPGDDGVPGFGPDGSTLVAVLDGLTIEHGGQRISRPYPVGFPITVQGLGDGRFLVASADPSPHSAEWLPIHVSADLEMTRLAAEPSLRLARFFSVPSAPGKIIAVGFVPVQKQGVAFLCAPTAADLNCRRITPAESLDRGTQANVAVAIDERRVFVAADFDHGSSGLPIVLVDVESGTFADSVIPSAHIDEFGDAGVSAAGALGSTIYVLGGGALGTFVAAKELSDDLLSSPDPAAALAGDWKIVSRAPTKVGCSGIVRSPGRLYLGCADDSSVEIRSDGTIAWVRTSSVFGVPGPVDSIASEGEWAFATSRGRAIYRRFRDGAFEHVVGPSPPRVGAFGAIVERAEGFLAFAHDGLVAPIDGQGVPSPSWVASGIRGQSVGAALSDGQVFLATSRPDGKGSVYRFPAVGGEARELASQPAWSVRSVSEGEVLALTPDGVSVLRDETVESVAINWDDPVTPDVEARPEACEGTRPGVGGDHAELGPLKALDSVGRIAWAVGCDYAIVRLARSKSGWSGQRLSFDRSGAGLGWDDRGFTAVRALAPDDVLVAAPGRGPTVREQGLIWRVSVSSDGRRLDGRLVQDPPPNPLLGIFAGDPLNLFGDSRTGIASVVVGSSHTSFRWIGSSQQSLRFGRCSSAAWNPTSDTVLMGCEGETLLLGRP